MLIIFYFSNVCYSSLCFFSLSIITNHVLYQDYVLYYNLCFRKICEYVNFFSFFSYFCKSGVDIKAS